MPNGKKSKKAKGRNFYPIIKHIGDIPIRTNNIITVYIPQHEMEKIAAIMNATGLSCAKVLAHSSTPCDHCKGTKLAIMVGDVEVEIPRGLFQFRKSNSGATMSNKKRKK